MGAVEASTSFLAGARWGSSRGAARVPGTTQATVGRRVAALEAALGLSLLEMSWVW